MFQTIKSEAVASITEKKSKFICHIFHVESADEAEEILAIIRKKYHDARHNCYAYKIIEGDITKVSDDGEPSGTAGVPILNILNGKNLSNILVVVTRYFGGILLGTGGLVRAYSLATTTAIENAELYCQELGLEAEFFVEYKELDELKYCLSKRKIEISNLEYSENIKVTVIGENNNINCLLSEKISDRIILKNVRLLGNKYIIFKEN